MAKINKIRIDFRWDAIGFQKHAQSKYSNSITQELYYPSKPSSLRSIIKLPEIKLSADGPWLAGGAARCLYFGKKIKSDIDIFFQDPVQLAVTRAKMLHPIDDPNYELDKISDHAENYKILTRSKNYDVQLITYKFYNSIDDLFGSFDFTCCQFAYDGSHLYYTDEAVKDTESKSLIYANNRKFDSFFRISKYLKKGFIGKLPEIFHNTKLTFLSEEEIDYKISTNWYDKSVVWTGTILPAQIEHICYHNDVIPERIQLAEDSYGRRSPTIIKFTSSQDKNLFSIAAKNLK